MKEYLTQGKMNKKTLIVEDFSNLTNLAVNLDVGKELELNVKKQSMFCQAPAKVVKGYFVANRVFVLCSDKSLYEFQGISFVKRLEGINKTPTLSKVKFKGQDTVLVLSNSEAVVLGETNTNVSVPYGTDACTYNGRIFVANGNTLYFSKEFDFVDFSVQASDFNFINLDENDERIMRIFDYDKALLIVCEKAMYKLTISSDYDYALNKLYADSLKIEQGSVCAVGDSILFMNANKLCSYKKDRVSEIDSVISDYQLVRQDVAYSGGGKYYLPMSSMVDYKNYIYVYDTVSNKQCLTEKGSCALCGGEFYVDNSSGYICTLTLEKDTRQSGKWISKKVDFNTNVKKSLLSLSIHLDCDALLVVKGDFGSKEYSLKKGYCKKILNLYSCDFTFEISVDSGDLKAKNLQLEYSL
ncbi:MAG: hypothetical protein E7348_00170 [Clostridiales bacterium]|nr:hypothetical protein [Clostridiales bacterium]